MRFESGLAGAATINAGIGTLAAAGAGAAAAGPKVIAAAPTLIRQGKNLAKAVTGKGKDIVRSGTDLVKTNPDKIDKIGRIGNDLFNKSLPAETAEGQGITTIYKIGEKAYDSFNKKKRETQK
ncbi:hypothetical protein GO013_12935 [Pseudodesulfovibrio sp. JC047]|uniref:hypothetical protein n=1 Tax=Pseudodesulfovibrio sp. JC047 TaxID=2683199 RepID=UPI0013D4A688|nr:hypothetical protein [Pseudodesulfovibrio sp. JC047]NDV20314.1 hypothetical protein [Pseudodesulfovibrio sp. JC047]